METMYAVDSFGAHTAASAQALAAAGVRCALRYHYNTTADEVRALHDHGISFCLIAEFDTASWHPPLDSPDTGADHARTAVTRARSLGLPAGAKITFTVDTMVYPQDYNRVRRYFELAAPIVRAAGYLVDAYGGSLLIDDLHDRGLTDVTWEAAARSWSSSTGRVGDYVPSRTATMRQHVEQPVYGGVQCDLNTFLREPVGEWMPDGSVTGPGTSTEDSMANKAVFAPDQTGGVGWRAFVVDGQRWREGYSSREDLDVDLAAGVVDGEIELRGDAGGRFLYRFAEWPAIPPSAPRLVTCAADTWWARNIAGLAAGERGRFLLVPNRYLIRVRDDEQWNSDRFVGVPDGGEFPAAFLANQPLMPWALPSSVLDPVAMATAINAALDDVEIDTDLSADDVDAIARRVVDRFAGTVHFATDTAA